MCKLEMVDLSNNELEALPEEIGKMRSLKWLIVSENGLVRLPKAIERLKDTLDVLDLSGNRIANGNGIGTIGKDRLLEVFGPRVVFSSNTIGENEYKILIREVYVELEMKETR